ncbi:retrotransposon protein, putative, ty1-copia subclass [Tanacetum coccineum]
MLEVANDLRESEIKKRHVIEQPLPPAPEAVAEPDIVAQWTVNGKGKDKKVYIPKPNNPKPTAMERPAKDDACHHCKEVGHWKRNCPVYLAELQKRGLQVGSASFSRGFRIERKLKQGALYCTVGIGVRAKSRRQLEILT